MSGASVSAAPHSRPRMASAHWCRPLDSARSILRRRASSCARIRPNRSGAGASRSIAAQARHSTLRCAWIFRREEDTKKSRKTLDKAHLHNEVSSRIRLRLQMRSAMVREEAGPGSSKAHVAHRDALDVVRGVGVRLQDSERRRIFPGAQPVPRMEEGAARTAPREPGHSVRRRLRTIRRAGLP